VRLVNLVCPLALAALGVGSRRRHGLDHVFRRPAPRSGRLDDDRCAPFESLSLQLTLGAFVARRGQAGSLLLVRKPLVVEAAYLVNPLATSVAGDPRLGELFIAFAAQ
jgi:hypothetical protein